MFLMFKKLDFLLTETVLLNSLIYSSNLFDPLLRHDFLPLKLIKHSFPYLFDFYLTFSSSFYFSSSFMILLRFKKLTLKLEMLGRNLIAYFYCVISFPSIFLIEAALILNRCGFIQDLALVLFKNTELSSLALVATDLRKIDLRLLYDFFLKIIFSDSFCS